MAQTVPTDRLARQLAALADDMTALDRGVIEAGVTASQALARADALEQMLATAFRAAGLERDDEDEAAETFADVVAAGIEARARKAEARRRRIAASGLTLVRGGAQ